MPDGEDGEICVCGVFGECYLNLDEQSARTFEHREDGKVLLHTGDIGRKLPDGNYIYVNRKDWMVKINGQRVETGEIELRMAAAPGVKNAVVKAFEDENGQNYLCGYYVAGEEVMPEDIRVSLRESLPDYMIPRFLKRMEELPKNINGKLDRKALLPPGISAYKREYREPENEIQKQICEAFETILHCGKTGIGDDYFRLGGDSINVLKLVESLADFSLTPGMVLKGRTPEQISFLLQEKKGRTRQRAPRYGFKYGSRQECGRNGLSRIPRWAFIWNASTSRNARCTTFPCAVSCRTTSTRGDSGMR